MLVFTRNCHFGCFFRHKRNVRTVRVWSFRHRGVRSIVSCELGRLKCFVVTRGTAVHQWSCLSGLSVDEFQDLLIQIGQVLKAKMFNRCCILLVGLGGPTLRKKSVKWESGDLPFHGMAELPRILFGREEGNLRSTRLALMKWRVSASAGKGERTISCQMLSSSPGVCCYCAFVLVAKYLPLVISC